jgi:hypothetical protein
MQITMANGRRYTAISQPIQELLQESKTVLLRIRTVFPFDFFPDEIIIDENKLSVISKSFFMTYHIHSILIADITDVSVDTGLLFASLTIIDSSNYRFPIIVTVPLLKKADAFAARKLLQGLISAQRRNISLGDMSAMDVKEEISQVGRMQGRGLREA